MSSSPSPFPFDRWPRMSANSARFLTYWNHAYTERAGEALRQTVNRLLGAEISWEVLGLFPFAASTTPTYTIALDGDARVRVELPGALVAWTIDRALGGEARLSTLDAGLVPVADDALLGVLAYVATRLITQMPVTLSVVDVERTSSKPTVERAAQLHVRVSIDGTPFTLKLSIDEASGARAATATTRVNPQVIAHLRHVPAQLSVQLTRVCRLTERSLMTLQLDDVISIPHDTLRRDGDRCAGIVRVGVLGATTTLWLATVLHDGFELQPIDHTEIPSVATNTQPSTNTNDLTAVADAPLDVSVELARVSLPLGEIAKLVAGDVLSTGRPIGELVTLRMGTRAVAIGELVDVDGCIGVRVTSIVK